MVNIIVHIMWVAFSIGSVFSFASSATSVNQLATLQKESMLDSLAELST